MSVSRRFPPLVGAARNARYPSTVRGVGWRWVHGHHNRTNIVFEGFNLLRKFVYGVILKAGFCFAALKRVEVVIRQCESPYLGSQLFESRNAERSIIYSAPF